ncbi:MAG: methyltransferase domain-containing protein [Chloroflexota bacterium]|nr:methyltransferase domain-containing protein [Dehalococcoidia bacterium]MDW8253763.1 methyltransferase domain-containing protein [Chloroflexota bacterium]
MSSREEVHQIRELGSLACPECRSALVQEGATIRCGGCLAVYPIVRGIPYLLSGDGVERTTLLYDAVARHYDDTLPKHVMDHYRRKRLGFVKARQPQGDLLDVGCGTGHLAAAFAAEGYRVYGCDASIGMLDIFRNRCDAVVVGGRSDELPFPDNRFDVVICVALLHHVVEPARVATTIREMVRVTKPGGLTVLWDHNPLNPYWPILMKRVPQDDGSERLIPLRELLAPLPRSAQVEVHRLGFMPDFLPAPLVPLGARVEALLERTPLLRALAAHNVVAVRKR